MDTDAYLNRIGVSGPVDVSLESLERLQRAHLTHVPFENLDVFHRRGVRTDVEWSSDKIVTKGRGGWCFELNGAFASLLSALGFETRRLGANVSTERPDAVSPDHATIEVTMDRPYLVDVGFGDSFIRPLPLDTESPSDGGTGNYRISFEDDLTALMFEEPEGYVPQYWFGDRTVTTDDFDPSSHRLQTEPGLRWTQGPFATRLLDGGPDRVTLLRDRIKFRRDGEWTEQPVEEGAEWDAALLKWFNLTP